MTIRVRAERGALYRAGYHRRLAPSEESRETVCGGEVDQMEQNHKGYREKAGESTEDRPPIRTYSKTNIVTVVEIPWCDLEEWLHARGVDTDGMRITSIGYQDEVPAAAIQEARPTRICITFQGMSNDLREFR